MSQLSKLPTYDKVLYIHDLQREQNFVEMVLCIAEYGYMQFFSNYALFLADLYEGHETLQSLYWDECFDVYTSSEYSQLYTGLEMPPYGYLQKRRGKNRYEWYDNLVLGKEGLKTDILKHIFGT